METKLKQNITIKNQPMLNHASDAEILRSHQRDSEFVKHLQEKLSEIMSNFGINQNLFQYIEPNIPFKIIYFIFTSGMGNQTLGEEYTSIVQADLKAHKVPTLTVRILAAILECFGEKIFLKLLRELQIRVNHPDSELTPTAVKFLNTFLSKLRTAIPIFILLHKGIFYIYGRYYSLSRRITGIDYIKIYGNRSVNVVSWGLRLLGITTIIQCLLKAWQNYQQNLTTQNSTTNWFDKTSTSRTCQLCLEATATSATLCGHLFCWNCLSEWLRTKPQCPFCREHMPPSRIIHLINL